MGLVAAPYRAFILTLALIWSLGASSSALAQSAPPLTVPAGGPPLVDPMAHVIDGWQLRGAIDSFVQNSNNYLLTSPAVLSGWSVGLNPHGTAEWSNGIHSTVLFASYQRLEYKTVGTDDGEVTARQSYSPLRDLKLSIEGDYTHHTLASNLTSAIPAPITTTATTVLTNGNTVLPNGTIVAPNGQIVGQTGQTAGVGTIAVVNPYDQYTGTGRVEKIFNGGVAVVSASTVHVNYENAASHLSDFSARTISEDLAFWLGPVFYVYSDGSYTSRINTAPVPNSTAYRVIGGIGTDRIGLFRFSAYAGDQGSAVTASGTSGGIVYGGAISYEPFRSWILYLTFDHTTNASSQTGISTEALPLPGQIPLQLPLSSSSEINSVAWRSEYRPSPQWAILSFVGYTNVRDLLGTNISSSWILDTTVQYDLLRNLTLSFELQRISILSPVPAASVNRDLVMARSSYRF